MQPEMRQFQVQGVSRESEDDQCFTIEAHSRENARVKAELRGIVATAITELEEDGEPHQEDAERPTDETGGERQAEASTATLENLEPERWPWRRMARWTYNWRSLVAVWTVFNALFALGALANISDSPDEATVLGPPMTSEGWAVTAAIQVLVVVGLARAYWLLVRRPDRGARWLLGVLIVFSASDLVALGAASAGASETVAQGGPGEVFGSTIAGGLLILLVLPLLKPRFIRFGQLLERLHGEGVPSRFLVRRSLFGAPEKPDFDPHMPYEVQPDEPRTRLKRLRLMRAISTGRLVVPREVRWNTVAADSAVTTCDAGAGDGTSSVSVETSSLETGSSDNNVRDTKPSAFRFPQQAINVIAASIAVIVLAATGLVVYFTIANSSLDSPSSAEATVTEDSSAESSAASTTGVDSGGRTVSRWPEEFTSPNRAELGDPVLPPLSDQLVKDMAQARGFYIGQTLVASPLSRRFPSMRRDFQVAQMQLSSRFGPTVAHMDEVLTGEVSEWPSIRDRMTQQIQQRIQVNRMSQREANQALREVERASRGDLPPSILRTLLALDPEYLRRPEREMSDGYKNTYRSQGGEKSRGLRIALDLPTSWEGTPGRMPHIVRKWMSANGHGFNMVAWGVFPWPVELKETDRVGEVFAGVNPRMFAQQAAEGVNQRFDQVTVIDAGRVDLVNRSTVWATMDIEAERVGTPFQMRMLSFWVPYDEERLLMLQFAVMSPNDEEADLSHRLRRYGPLFRLITNSLVVFNQYEEPFTAKDFNSN